MSNDIEAFYLHEGKTSTIEITIVETPNEQRTKPSSLKPYIMGFIFGVPIPFWTSLEYLSSI